MAYCYYRYGQRYCTNNRWYDWGRWVLLGAIILVALLAFFLFACISARRRRKFGQKPLMMTGWAAPGHGPVTYNPNRPAKNGNDTYPTYAHYGSENAGTAPPPAYGANADYYGSGANAQPGTYQAPQYPPPAASRGDGVVR